VNGKMGATPTPGILQKESANYLKTNEASVEKSAKREKESASV
jgi:hypothetical protein